MSEHGTAIKKSAIALRHLASVLLLLVCICVLAASTASADTVTYIDENGQEQTATDVRALTSGTTNWTGWYMVTGQVTIGSRIVVNGAAHLILCDDAELNASDGITVCSGNTLSIYAQSEGSGRLSTSINSGSAAIGGNSGDNRNAGKIVINGGIITVDNKGSGAAIGGGIKGSGGTIMILGGTVTDRKSVV